MSMLTYQATDKTVTVSFSKEFLTAQELAKFVELLRIKELLAKSQMTEDDVMQLDDELKESWWQGNKDRFLDKIKWNRLLLIPTLFFQR